MRRYTVIDAADVKPWTIGARYSATPRAVTALLDLLLHHAYVLKCGPRSWRTKLQTDSRAENGTK